MDRCLLVPQAARCPRSVSAAICPGCLGLHGPRSDHSPAKITSGEHQDAHRWPSAVQPPFRQRLLGLVAVAYGRMARGTPPKITAVIGCTPASALAVSVLRIKHPVVTPDWNRSDPPSHSHRRRPTVATALNMAGMEVMLDVVCDHIV